MANTKRILIADDDEDLLRVMEERCCQMGLRVETARDGMSAIQKIDSQEPDLVILDINMPCGSGLDVCQMASREPLLKAIPVIILTGRKDRETILRCRNLHTHYVSKSPDVWATLEPLVRKLLGLNGCQVEQGSAASEDVEQAVRRAEGEHPHPPAIHSKTFSQLPPPDGRSSIQSQNRSEEIQNRYFDAIFSALGWSESHSSEIKPPASPNETQRPCILCIDDDADFSNSLKLRLQQHGFDVDQACAGMAGYRQAFTSVAQAIILDFQMPDGNGAYILRRLKENPVTSGIPTIVLTGRKDKSLERTVYNLGASRFLTKPVEWDKLLAELDRHVRSFPEAAAS